MVFHLNFYDLYGGQPTPQEAAKDFPWTLTYTVLGDGGLNGLNRIYQGGDPSTATVTVHYDDFERGLVVGAVAPFWVSVGQTVNIPLTVTNTGSVDSLTPINITSTHFSKDPAVDDTNEPRMACQFDGPIAAGESKGCEVAFLVQEKDLNWRNGAEIELDVVASDGRTASHPARIYMRVRNGVSVGFKETTRFEVTEPRFGEANAKANLTVTRLGRSNEIVQVAYTLEPWPTKNRPYPPVEGVDYADNSATPGVLTFGPNDTEKTITIDILGDRIDEEKEQFRVTLVPPEGVLVEDDKKYRTVVINDAAPPPGDPYRPTASLQLVSSGPVPENEGPVEFAIVLDRVWGKDGRYEAEVLLDQTTATPGIAALGKEGDFEEPLIRILRIPAGQTRFEFSVPLYDDDVREEDETFQLQLTSPYDDSFRTIGTSYKALATIADDDRIPPTEVELSLSHNGNALESVPEDSNRRDITVTASFSLIRWPGDASDAPLRPADLLDVDTTVRVQVDLNSGATHAADREDFAPLRMEDDLGDFQDVESFDVVIPAGQTSGNATVRFRPVNDDVDEEDETVTLQGSEVVGGGSEDSLPFRSASFTIEDDDTRGITVAPARVLLTLPLVEGGEPGTYSLVLDSQPTDTVVITLAGNQGGFLRIVPDTLTFTTSDWAIEQMVSVMALDDGIAGVVAPTDFVAHQVSGGDYGSVTVPDISTLIEDTTKAFVYLEGGQASESDSYVEFSVTVRPILRTTPVLVRYATVDGTVIAGSDYTREVETGQIYKILNIPAGRSSATIRIPITDDQVYESADKTFTLQLTNHNNKATLEGDATSLTAIGAIADDDPKPVVSVAGPAGDISYVSENVKDPVTFTLTLIDQSAGDVTVDYATGEAGPLGLFTDRQGGGLAGATQYEDYARTSGTVTFTSGQTTKTVTVQVTNDDVSEDTEFFGFTISSPQGADLRGQRSQDVANVGLLDDDARGVTIGPTSISLHEPASGETAVAGSYTVNLNTRPTDTVTVTIGGNVSSVSLSGDTLTNNQLTFTTTNWNTAQTITVTPVKDDNAVGETVTLTHTLSGGDYVGIAADSVTVNLIDSDTGNLVLSKQSLTVTEGDATGVRYTVKLATQPSGEVTVTISGHASRDLTLDKTTLTFTVGNWNTAQTVTVEAGHDDDDANDNATLTHTASGGDYASVTKNLLVTVTDDDEAAVVLSETGLTVTEGDAAGSSYTVVLATEPTGEVTVTVSGHVSTDLTLNKTTLTFRVNNWNTAQTVTVKAGQDDDDATLKHTASVSNTLPVTLTDDDTAAIVLSRTALTVTEGDAAGSTYTVVLATEPTGEVTVTVSGHAGTDLTLDKTTLTFTVDSWDTAQTVTVKAIEDVDAANDTATLTHTASGGDYASVTKNLLVTVTDDDTPDIVLSETGLTVTEGDAAGSSYTVKLATQPTGSVSVSITGHAGTDLTLDNTTLTFTVDNWDTAQTVTVKAGQDDDAASDTGTLTHTASGGDYASVTKNLPVTVTDDDTPAVVLSETGLTVTEGDAAGTSYTVSLATEPSGSVSVSITGHAGTDLTLDKTTLTFTVDNWDTAQTVTVKAGQDDDAANDTATLTHTASGGDYASITADLPVTLTDDDTATVVLSETGLTVTEGDAAGTSYTVSLATEPSGSVSVSISGHAGTDLSLDNTPLTFTLDNWNTVQTVTVEAGQDHDGANDTGTLTHTASGGDYASVSNTLPVTVTDDAAAIVLSETDLTVTEGDAAGSSYTVRLATQPSDTVIVTISGHDGTDLTLDKTTLTFTVDNWDVAQTVTVEAGHDDDGSADTATPTHTASGGDYVNITKDLPVTITDDDCEDDVIWCATATFDAEVEWVGRYNLHAGEVDRREFSYNGEDYLLWSIGMDQNGHNAGDDNNIVLPFGIPERTEFLIDFLNLNGTGHQEFEPPNDDWLDWTLHVSTVSDGETLTAALSFSEARKLGGAWWRWSGGDIDDLRRAWKPGQLYKLRLVEDPRSERTPQPLNTPLYLHVQGEEDGGRTQLYWLTPQTRYDLVPPVDNYKIQWKQSSGSWGTAADVSETTQGPSRQRPVSYRLDGLSPGIEYNIRVIATDSVGDSEPSNEITYLKPASTQQSLPNTPAEGEPRIDGTPDVGQTLSADTTAIADADGLEEVVFQYQWLAEDADIPDAISATYTEAPGDVGKVITVRVAFADDGGHEETLTSTPALGLQLQSATVDGALLTLTYDEVLDNGVTLGTTPFAVNVNGSSRPLIAVGVGESNVLLFPSSAVDAGDMVTVDYTAPDGPDFIRDTQGKKAASFSGQAVMNDTASPPLTASAHDAPSSHNGQDAFIFELRFSEDPEQGFSYTTVQDHALTVTGGSVIYVRRLKPGKNVRWEITVTPGSTADVTIDLTNTTDCSVQGALCTEDGGKLSGGLLLAVPGPNTPATGLPSITGTAQVGQTFTADTTGISDYDGLYYAAFSYQWLAHDAEINEATASTYTLTDYDEGKTIKVRVSFTDDDGNEEELTSALTGAVAAAPPPPSTPATGAPTISGTAQVGETLTADTTAIADSDGLYYATFAYQWLADDAEINGANASTYTIVADDEGKAIKVKVYFTDDAGNEEQLTSAGTGVVAAAPPPTNTPATGLPTITGAAEVGETLTTDITGISDGDGLYYAAFDYQWLADDAEINGATVSTYTLVADDEGKAIKVMVSFTDDTGNDEELISAATGAVAAAPPSPNTPATGAPSITGDAQVGETLTADITGISDGDGLYYAAFDYQWLADDAEINGANASTYTLVDDDEGKVIKVMVSFTDDADNDEKLTSAVTGEVAAVVNPPLTATIYDVPSSHNGQDAFIFELRFSEAPKPDFSYTTVRDHALTVTGGAVTYVRRLEPGENVRWEITVTPGSSADVAIALNATTDCFGQGAICTEDGGMLSGGLELTVNRPGQ